VVTNPLSDIYNYRRVSPLIHTAGQPTEDQLAAAAEAGCVAVVNLGLTDTDYALPDERRTVEALGMDYLHIPVVWERPARCDLDRFARTLVRYEGKPLLVHCAANVRVSVFVALDRVTRLGWSVEDAFAPVDQNKLPPVWRRFIDDVLTEEL
jgi:protein tyrosine phosphatase (PTP) superfamily phosphohydrolase (DUF442 family)